MAKAPQDRKPKAPTFHVVNTGQEEIKVSLKLKFRHVLKLSALSEMEGDMAAVQYLLDEALPAEISDVILDLDDDVAIPQMMSLLEALGVRLGATLGESDGSSDSETSTEEP